MTDETSSIKRVTQDDCYLITSDVTLSPSVILQDIVMALGGAVFPVSARWRVGVVSDRA